MHVAGPEAGILEAASRDREPLAHEGYVAGLAHGQALLEAGRATGETRLWRLMDRGEARIPLTVERVGGADLAPREAPGSNGC